MLEFFKWLSDEAVRRMYDPECRYNLNVSDALVSIILTTHNILRQRQNSNTLSNMQTKSAATDFPICFKGKIYTVSRASSERAWRDILENNGLKYDVEKDSKGNWIGTMGPYLNMLGCWGLRLQELRVGCQSQEMGRR